MKSLVLRPWVRKWKDYTNSNVILQYTKARKSREPGKAARQEVYLCQGYDESPARNRMAFGRLRAAGLGCLHQSGRECCTTRLPFCPSISNNFIFIFPHTRCFSYSFFFIPDFFLPSAQDFISLCFSSCITFLLPLLYYFIVLLLKLEWVLLWSLGKLLYKLVANVMSGVNLTTLPALRRLLLHWSDSLREGT